MLKLNSDELHLELNEMALGLKKTKERKIEIVPERVDEMVKLWNSSLACRVWMIQESGNQFECKTICLDDRSFNIELGEDMVRKA